MTKKIVGRILSLHAQTSLHPGSGTALGTVDLPVQRERHTQWPSILGSSLKGVLRDQARQQKGGGRQADSDEEIIALFGPSSQSEKKFSGAVSVTDARLLAFPVRSMKGVFAWVTCPEVLRRFLRDLSLVGQGVKWAVPDVRENLAKVPDESPNTMNKKLILEEFDFDVEVSKDADDIAKWVADKLLSDIEEYKSTKERLRKSLIVIDDDSFTHFTRFATEVAARIGLDYETKTVKKGALFYQEFLPPETLFYSLVLVNGSRSGDGKNAEQLLDNFQSILPRVLQVGGDETTGKGFCSVRLS